MVSAAGLAAFERGRDGDACEVEQVAVFVFRDGAGQFGGSPAGEGLHGCGETGAGAVNPGRLPHEFLQCRTQSRRCGACSGYRCGRRFTRELVR